MKEKSDPLQPMAQINENILLCEFNLGRHSGQVTGSRLDELIDN